MNAQIKREITYFIAALSIVLPILGYVNNFLKSSETIIVHAQEAVDVTITPTPTLEPIVQPQRVQFENEMQQYVADKFGDHYEEAFKIVQCESGWKTTAFNDNTTWGGVGRDWNLFQINDVYHPVYELNLHTDWKANVDYAYRMFLNDDKTFVRWTCNKIIK